MFSARRAALVLIAASVPSATDLPGQAIAGTYTTANAQGGTITLVLQADGPGKVSGSLAGNGNTFVIAGTMGDDAADGTVSGNGMQLFFGARLQGEGLLFLLAEPDASGQPDFARATPMQFRRSATAVAPSTAAAPRGNPLAGARPADADRYAGAWTSKDVSLSLSSQAGAYAGTLTHQGNAYPVTLKADGPGLSGTFTAGGSPYEVLVKVENGMLYLRTAGTTYMLARGAAGAGANPLGGSAATSAPAAPALSAQDQQMVRMFTANAWCSFSYSGSSGSYSSGGVSRSQKVYLRPDGTLVASSGSERTSSGEAGQAYVGNQGTAQGYWKFENGQFYLGQSPQALAPQQFRMTFNSNGYPIPIINGTEYMICR